MLVLTGVLLYGVSRYALKVYFRTAGIRPGVSFLGVEVGGLGAVPARELLEGAVHSRFRFPVLLELGESTYFLYLGDHFRVEVDHDALIEAARGLEADEDLWDRALRHLRADFQPVTLPWKPTLDREFTSGAIARLIEDRTENRIHAFLLPDGRLKVVVSNPADQVQAIVDQLAELVQLDPLPERPVIRPGVVSSSDDEYVVAPDDPERGFRVALGSAEVTLDPARPLEARNVARGLERLYGLVLNPGEELSLAEAAGPFTTEAGYEGEMPLPVVLPPDLGDLVMAPRDAGLAALEPSLQSTEPIHVGTGVERLAGAVFQALVRAGADVLARSTHPHFTPDLAYTPLGMDVRLLPGPGLPPGELVLRNRWDFPLRILGSLSPTSVRIDVVALAEPKSVVEIRIGVPEKVPYKTELVRDPDTPRGVERVERDGVDGFRVKIFRNLVRKDGLPTQEHPLGEPVDYAPLPGRIVLGTGDPRELRERERRRQHERLLEWMDSGTGSRGF